MKQINFKNALIMAFATLLLQACSSGPKPEDTATEFLKAYFSTDYAKAAEFCTPELGKDLTDAVKELESLSPEVKELMKRHTRNYTPQIGLVEGSKESDTVIVSYTIVNLPQADSISTGGEAVIEKQLSLVKVEEGWRVAALNNNR